LSLPEGRLAREAEQAVVLLAPPSPERQEPAVELEWLGLEALGYALSIVYVSHGALTKIGSNEGPKRQENLHLQHPPSALFDSTTLIEAVFLHHSFISISITLIVVINVQHAADKHAELRGEREEEDAEALGKQQRQQGDERNLVGEWAACHPRGAANVFEIPHERDLVTFSPLLPSKMSAKPDPDALSDGSRSDDDTNEYNIIVDSEYEMGDSQTKRKSKQLVSFDTGSPDNFIFRAALSRMGPVKVYPLPQRRCKAYSNPTNPDSIIVPKYYVSVIIRNDEIQLCPPAIKLKVMDVEGYSHDQYRRPKIILGGRFIRKYGGHRLLAQVANTEINLFDLDTASKEEQDEHFQEDLSQTTDSNPPSVFSDPPSGSSSSQLSTTNLLSSVDQLVALLLGDQTLNNLYTAALQRPTIEPEHFERKFRHLLNQYSLDLTREAAQTPLHQEAANFVRFRARYVSNRIRKAFELADERGKHLSSWLESEKSSEKDLGRFIHEWNDSSSPLLKHDEARDSDAEELDNLDEVDIDENIENNLQSLANFKEFMVSGNAFRNLQQNLKDFVHPPSATKDHTQPSTDAKNTTLNPKAAVSSGQASRNLDDADEDKSLLEENQQDPPHHLSLTNSTILMDHGKFVCFTPSALVSSPGLINQAKKIVEVSLGCPIIWWPLQPLKETCPEDYARISWDCVSF
jgi:hypothetical protein